MGTAVPCRGDKDQWSARDNVRKWKEQTFKTLPHPWNWPSLTLGVPTLQPGDPSSSFFLGVGSTHPHSPLVVPSTFLWPPWHLQGWEASSSLCQFTHLSCPFSFHSLPSVTGPFWELEVQLRWVKWRLTWVTACTWSTNPHLLQHCPFSLPLGWVLSQEAPPSLR